MRYFGTFFFLQTIFFIELTPSLACEAVSACLKPTAANLSSCTWIVSTHPQHSTTASCINIDCIHHRCRQPFERYNKCTIICSTVGCSSCLPAVSQCSRAVCNDTLLSSIHLYRGCTRWHLLPTTTAGTISPSCYSTPICSASSNYCYCSHDTANGYNNHYSSNRRDCSG